MSTLHAVAQSAVEQMALSLVGGTAVAACTWAALRLAPRQSARARFALWFGVLVSIALLPLLALLRGVPVQEGLAPAATRAWLTIPESWAAYVVGLWTVIAFAGLARVAVGLLQVRRVRASCEEFPVSDLPECIRDTLARFPPRRPLRLCVSDAVRVPTAIGFFRPAVVIPRWLLAELPAAELKQVVLHELAHLARRDDWTNLAQKLVRAALFFHPAVWWIDRRLSLEREMACDDAVIAATDDRHSYARCLAMLAEKTLGRRTAALAQAAVQRIQQVTARVIRILEPQVVSVRGGWTWAVTAMSALAVGGTIALGGSAPLIGFQPPVSAFAQAQRAATPLSRPSDVRIVPAAMRVTEPAAPAKKTTPQHKKKPARMMANDRAPAFAPLGSQAVTSNVIPAKAQQGALQGNSSNVVVFTVFSSSQDSQSWNVQVWQLTVYVPAPVRAAGATPRKTT